MSNNSRFFADGTDYTQPEFAQALSSFKDGYQEGYLNELAVTESSPQAMSVDLDTGSAWVQGYYYNNSASQTLTINTADATNPRIDTVILRLSPLATQNIIAVVLEGTPSATPVAPTLTQTGTTYEIALYDVAVAAGATTILNADLTDRRVIGGIGTAEVPSATETVEGIIRKATTAEAEAGISDVGAMTPQKTKEAIDELSPDYKDDYCHVNRTNAQLSGTKVEFDTIIKNDGSIFNASNNTRFTAQTAGNYTFCGGVNISTSSTSFEDTYAIKINNVEVQGDMMASGYSASSSAKAFAPVNFTAQMAQNDYLEIEFATGFSTSILATSGTNITVQKVTK